MKTKIMLIASVIVWTSVVQGADVTLMPRIMSKCIQHIAKMPESDYELYRSCTQVFSRDDVMELRAIWGNETCKKFFLQAMNSVIPAQPLEFCITPGAVQCFEFLLNQGEDPNKCTTDITLRDFIYHKINPQTPMGKEARRMLFKHDPTIVRKQVGLLKVLHTHEERKSETKTEDQEFERWADELCAELDAEIKNSQANNAMVLAAQGSTNNNASGTKIKNAAERKRDNYKKKKKESQRAQHAAALADAVSSTTSSSASLAALSGTTSGQATSSQSSTMHEKKEEPKK